MFSFFVFVGIAGSFGRGDALESFEAAAPASSTEGAAALLASGVVIVSVTALRVNPINVGLSMTATRCVLFSIPLAKTLVAGSQIFPER